MRHRTWRAPLIAAILALALGLPVAAQVSNLFSSTAGLYTGAPDLFLSTSRYGELELEKGFGYVGYDNSYLTLGYAGRLGGIYLGSYYSGTVLSTANTPTESVSVAQTPLLDASRIIVGESVTTTSSWTTAPQYASTNNGRILIGVAGMGFKLNVSNSLTAVYNRYGVGTVQGTALAGWNTGFAAVGSAASDVVTETIDADGGVTSRAVTDYGDGFTRTATIQPEIQWGMRMEAGGLVLRPEVTLIATFYEDAGAASLVDYTQVMGAGNPSFDGVNDLYGTYAKEAKEYSKGYFGIGANASIVAELGPGGDTAPQVGMTYIFGTRLYSNPYIDGSGKEVKGGGDAAWYEAVDFTQTSTDATTTTLRAWELVERSYMSNQIIPFYRFGGQAGERISWNLQGIVSAILQHQEQTTTGGVLQTIEFDDFSEDPAADYVQTIRKGHVGNTVVTDTLYIYPYANGGMRYALIPGALTLNAGVNVTCPRYYRQVSQTTKTGFNTRTQTTVLGTGEESVDTYTDEMASTRTESQTASVDWNAMSASVSAGFTWEMGEGFSLDARLSSSGFTLYATDFSVLLTVKR